MREFRTILYPTDFSDNARHAEPYVEELAIRFGARVVVFHAMMPSVSAGWRFETPLLSPATGPAPQTGPANTEEAEARRRLKEIRGRLAGRVPEVEAVLAVGTPFVEIIRAVRDHDVGLIVLCTHGWSGLKHVMLGSAAERVVRKAPCPVLTVRDPGHEFEHP